MFQNKYCLLLVLFYARTVINKFFYELIGVSIKTYKAEDLWQATITCIFRFKSCNYLQNLLTVSFFLFKLHTVLSFFQLYSFSKENQIRREEGCGTITSNNVVRMEKCFSNSNKQLWRLTEVKQYFFTSGSTVFYTHVIKIKFNNFTVCRQLSNLKLLLQLLVRLIFSNHLTHGMMWRLGLDENFTCTIGSLWTPNMRRCL